MEKTNTVSALKICARTSPCPATCPRYAMSNGGEECARQLMEVAAADIAAMQAEIAAYKRAEAEGRLVRVLDCKDGYKHEFAYKGTTVEFRTYPKLNPESSQDK